MVALQASLAEEAPNFRGVHYEEALVQSTHGMAQYSRKAKAGCFSLQVSTKNRRHQAILCKQGEQRICAADDKTAESQQYTITTTDAIHG